MQTEPSEKNWEKEWLAYNKNPYFKPNKRVIKIVSECFSDKLKNKKIIELGVGSGCDIVSLVQKGALGFSADFSEESLKAVYYWSKKKKVQVNAIKADIIKIPFPKNYFDMVYSVGLMEHFVDIIPYLKEQIRIIKPGGFLMIDVPQKYTLYTIAKHIRMKLNTHPFGWETEYSKGDLIKIANQLHQKIYRIYGNESDIISRLPAFIRPFCKKIFSRSIEVSPLAPYVCLNIGLVLKIVK